MDERFATVFLPLVTGLLFIPQLSIDRNSWFNSSTSIFDFKCAQNHLYSNEAIGAIPDSKVHGAMEPIWGWQDPGGPYVGPMNFAIRDPFNFATSMI